MPRTLIGELPAHDDGAGASALNALLAKQSMDKTLPALGRPGSLSIRFAKASDLEKVYDLYSGERKRQTDPQRFVRPRQYEEVASAVRNGSAALAIDENGHIRAAALAKRHHDGASGSQNLTEIGAVLCDVPGVGLSKLVISMLALKQQFDPHASGRVFAKVARDNGPSNTVFSKSLAWDAVCHHSEAPYLYDVAYRANKDSGKRDRIWYAFREKASERAVEILRNALDNEALHGKDGSSIKLNVSESSLWSTLHFHEMLASPLAAA